MANVIKIKRGLEKDISKLTLQEGELAVALDSQKLYVGDGDGVVQLVKASATGAVESADRLTTAREISATGDATGSVNFDGSKDVEIALALANSGVTAGTYTKVTVDAKGRVTTGNSLSKTDLPTITVEDISGLTDKLATKVDKVSGKGLSTNDYTAAEKEKLADLENYDDTEIKAEIAKKADSTAMATALAAKVDKVDGKGLSTEDYTSTEKTKLSGIEDNAEKNIVDGASSEFEISTDRTLSIKSVAMSKVSGLDSALGTKANSSDVYIKTQTYNREEIDAKVASVYRYKGSVANEAALPTSGQEVGDVYNLEDTGMNVAWDGNNWDELGISVDLTLYLTKDEASSIYAAKATTLAGYGIIDAYTTTAVDTALDGKVDKVTGKGLSTNDYTTAEKTKLSGIEESAEVNKINTVKVNGTALAITDKSVNIDLSSYATTSTTLSGYGIEDAYTKSEIDIKLSSKLSNTDTIDGGTF